MRNGEQRQATRFRKSAAVAVHKPPHQPLSAPLEHTAAAGNTRSDSSKKGCGRLMLGFSAWHYTVPGKPKESNYTR